MESRFVIIPPGETAVGPHLLAIPCLGRNWWKPGGFGPCGRRPAAHGPKSTVYQASSRVSRPKLGVAGLLERDPPGVSRLTAHGRPRTTSATRQWGMGKRNWTEFETTLAGRPQ